MTDREYTELDRVADEVIRLTTWRAIRRYVSLGGIGFIILDLAITLTVVVILAMDTRAADKRHAQIACRNTATIARIEHSTVAEQQRQTKRLAAQGIRFGIPKARFDRLVRRDAEQKRRFLAALDHLAKSNCTTLE